ncbi:MAG: ScpA family protein [Pseudomonadota bacterium]
MTDDTPTAEGSPALPADAPPAAALPDDALPDDVSAEEALIVDIDGYEGPLDVLLRLARTQKVDLLKISVLDLAEQYLGFVARARRHNLELAADYLVMAAWLAFLKSRLLLPVSEQPEEESDPEEMAAYLAFRLKRLEAMREAADKLMGLDRLGQSVFRRGAPEPVRLVDKVRYEASLYELLRAYARQRTKTERKAYRPSRPPVVTIETARSQFEAALGTLGAWSDLRQVLEREGFWPEELRGEADERIDWERALGFKRSGYASSFSAGLQLVKEGRLQMRQLRPFDALYVRRLEGRPSEASGRPNGDLP